jgi:hypothetical protein
LVEELFGGVEVLEVVEGDGLSVGGQGRGERVTEGGECVHPALGAQEHQAAPDAAAGVAVRGERDGRRWGQGGAFLDGGQQAGQSPGSVGKRTGEEGRGGRDIAQADQAGGEEEVGVGVARWEELAGFGEPAGVVEQAGVEQGAGGRLDAI